MSAATLKSSLPEDTAVRGEILSEYNMISDLPLLDQDILEVVMNNGIRIDVGWFPENDPQGRFLVRVFRKNQPLPIRPPLETKDPAEAETFVLDLAQQYSPRQTTARFIHVAWASTADFDFKMPAQLVT